MCPSCPFREGGDVELAGRVPDRTLLKASQICHHPRLHGKKEHELCLGARMHQLQILYRMGLIAEATEEAFQQKSRELGVLED